MLHPAVRIDATFARGDPAEVVQEVLEETGLPLGTDEDGVGAALDALEAFDVGRLGQGYFSVAVPGRGSSFTTKRFWISS